MQEVCNSDLLEYPPPTSGAKGPYKDRWCEFHKVKGHDTEECWDLMNQIERLIKDGYLKRGRGRAQESQPNSGVVHPGEEIRGTVTTIAGGFVGGGETSAARKRYARPTTQEVMTIGEGELQHPHLPAITFSDDDFKGITPHEHDPM
ncbi:hypothetical protein SESBI_31838 [Sesbania bispinosa]|nr:hypothetical protein SESBI_31838 [Sesbania bispinosa]